MSANSKINRQTLTEDSGAERAAARKAAITKALEATTGNAGLAEGDAAKGQLARDVAPDLKENR